MHDPSRGSGGSAPCGQFEAEDHLEATSRIAAGRILTRRSGSTPWKTGSPQRFGDSRSSVSCAAVTLRARFTFCSASRRSQSRLSEAPCGVGVELLPDRDAAGRTLRQRTMRAARRARQTGNRERRAESGAGHGLSRTCACCNQNPEPRFPAPSSGSQSSVCSAAGLGAGDQKQSELT